MSSCTIPAQFRFVEFPHSLRDNESFYQRQPMAAFPACHHRRKVDVCGIADRVYALAVDSKSLLVSVGRIVTRLWVDPLDDLLAAAGNSAVVDRVFSQVERKIGLHAANRLKKFTSYRNGWDSGSGKSLSNDSLRSLETFLSVVPDCSEGFAIFMSPQGNLILNWYDKANKLIEIEFLKNIVSCYIEATEKEIEIPVNESAIKSLLVDYA